MEEDIIKRFKASDVSDLVFPNKYGKLRSYYRLRRQFEQFIGKGHVPSAQAHLCHHDAGTVR